MIELLTLVFVAGLTACGGSLVQPTDGDGEPGELRDGGAEPEEGDDGGELDADRPSDTTSPDVRDADGGPDDDGSRFGPTCLFVDVEQGELARAGGEDFFAVYLSEILAHAGLPQAFLNRGDLTDGLDRCPVVVIAHDTTTVAAEQSALEAFVDGGGTLIAVGGTSGLDELLGVTSSGPRAEGFIDIWSGDELPLPAPPLPLHVFGGVGVTVTSAQPAASRLDENGLPTDEQSVTRRELGSGEAWFIAPDLALSVVTIQQGRPIEADGLPAPDGTAPIDDSILKTDDGIALDWTLDRDLVEGEPLFLQPVADLLRELLLGLILRGHARGQNPLPLLWYWPGELDAVGVISHDSDSNDPRLARVLLDEVTSLGLETTWCFMRYPETYPAELFAEVAAAGGEIALHYDARTGTVDTTWNEESYLSQLEWLRNISGATITTNKNHYLRWEGWVDFYRWLERSGLQADQSKGPSKSGNVGFLYGTCHPFFPMDDAANGNRLIDVLGINLFTQDLVHTCSYAIGPALVDRTVEHFGVAHFLFHPAHVEREGVAQAMRDVVEHGQSLGMQWWTVERINAWERARRRITIDETDGNGFRVTTPEPLDGVTLLVVLPSPSAEISLTVGSTPVSWERFSLYGTDTARFTADLAAGSTTVAVERERP